MNREFFFYKSYITDVEGCFTKEQYRQYLDAIVSYGIKGTYQIEDPHILPAFIQRKASIDASQERYKRAVTNGKKGGRKIEVTKKAIIEALKLGVPIEDLPHFLHCSERTISRKFNKQELKQLDMLAGWRMYVQRNDRFFPTDNPRSFMTKYDYFLSMCHGYGIKSDYLEYFKSFPLYSGHEPSFEYHHYDT